MNPNHRPIEEPKRDTVNAFGIAAAVSDNGDIIITGGFSIVSRNEFVDLLSDLGDLLGHTDQAQIIQNWYNEDR